MERKGKGRRGEEDLKRTLDTETREAGRVDGLDVSNAETFREEEEERKKEVEFEFKNASMKGIPNR